MEDDKYDNSKCNRRYMSNSGCKDKEGDRGSHTAGHSGDTCG